MNDEIFFERLNELSPTKNFSAELNLENSKIFLMDDGFIFELTQNSQGDAVKISLSTDDVNKKDGFYDTINDILVVYSPEQEFEQVKKELFDKGRGLFCFETDEYTYCSLINEAGLYFSVNNKKLNPEAVPELSLNANEDIRKTH